eukprot:scaffold3710_cov286-Chaetoceros_neogracile.AAC.37
MPFNADWEKAVRKNKKIAGEVESSKLNTGVDTMDTQEDANNSGLNSAEMVGVLISYHKIRFMGRVMREKKRQKMIFEGKAVI